MLDRVPDLLKKICLALFAGVALMLSSCATQKEPPRLVDDPDAKHESNIPWNKQEKWEVGQELSQLQGGKTTSDSR
jgi:hypothetical protein